MKANISFLITFIVIIIGSGLITYNYFHVANTGKNNIKPQIEEQPKQEIITKHDVGSYVYTKIIFDDRGCEYLVVNTGSGGVAVIHLPKCRNHY